ncbi:MAG: MarR family transcriptional regulator [Lachnospiraceae bacterium]
MKEESLQRELNHMMHLYRQLAMHILDEYGMKPHQAGILMALDRKDGLSQRELAELLRISPPSITVALQKMEQEGYLTREHDEKDQRIIRLTVTEKGESSTESVHDAFERIDEILFAKMNLEEKMLLRRLTAQMQENLLESLREQGMKNCFCSHHKEW